MARSLKERYETRQVQQLQERARNADAKVIEEVRYVGLLLEAMKEEDLQKVGAIIQKLNTIKSPELPHLSAAIEQAQAELNKYTGGGPLTAAWTKIKGMVGVDNPVVKITTFADALERGFAQVPQILKNNGVDLAKADLKQSLSTMLSTKAPTGQKSDKEMGKSPVTGKDVPAGGEKLNTPGAVPGAKSDEELGNTKFSNGSGNDQVGSHLPGSHSGTKPGTAPSPTRKPPESKNVGGQDSAPKPKPGVKPSPYKKPGSGGNGFSDSQNDWFKKGQKEGQDLDEAAPAGPSGEQKLKNITDQIRKALAPGGIFGAFKKVPYIDAAALAQELIAAPIQVFANVAKRIGQGTKAAEVAPDMKDQVTGQGSDQTKHAGTEQPAQATGQTQPGQPAKPGVGPVASTGAGQQPPKGPGESRGGGAEVKGQDTNKDTPENFKSGLNKIFKTAGVDGKIGIKLVKYLIDNKLIDRGAISAHGVEAAPGAQKKSA